jgi:low affinity Fe/Cu permease
LSAAALWIGGFYVSWMGLHEPTVTFTPTWHMAILCAVAVTTLIIATMLEYNHWQLQYDDKATAMKTKTTTATEM